MVGVAAWSSGVRAWAIRAVAGNVAGFLATITFRRSMRVGGVTSTPVVTFLVEDVLGAAALTPKAASASGNPGRGADTPGKFCLLVLLSEGMIGVLVVATGLSGLERVYGLSVQPVILDTAVQSGFFQLYVQPTAEPGRIAQILSRSLPRLIILRLTSLTSCTRSWIAASLTTSLIVSASLSLL